MRLPVAILLSTSVSLVAASAVPTAQEVLARAKAAQGGAAWDRIQTLDFEADLHTAGLDGTLHGALQLRTGSQVFRYDLKVAKGANGNDQEAAWNQDESGDVKLEDGPEARKSLITQRYDTVRGYWFPDRVAGKVSYKEARTEAGRSFHVLTLEPEGGYGYDLWVDAGTWRFDRSVSVSDGKTQVTRYEDYRSVAGVWIPFRTVSGNGQAPFETRIQYRSARVDSGLGAASFNRPRTSLNDSGIKGDAASTSLALEYRRDHIFVQVRLNGKGPYRFFLDTGGVNLMPPSLAKELGLNAQGAVAGGGVGEKTEAFSLTKVAQVEVGDAWLRDQSFYVIPSFDGVSKLMGLEVSGVVGYELFRRFVARIDIEAGRLTLTRPDRFRADGTGISVPFTFRGHTPQVRGELDGVAGLFDLDTGSGSILDVYTPFATREHLKDKAARSIHEVIGTGVGGEVWGDVIRARELKVGAAVLAAPVVSLAQASTGAYANAEAVGNIGLGFLKRFTLTFDYSRQILGLEPNRAWADRPQFGMTGIQPTSDRSGQVRLVHPGSPAEAAGILPGDRVLTVNGKPYLELDPDQLRRLFQQPGTTVELTLRRGEVERKVSLLLRELI